MSFQLQPLLSLAQKLNLPSAQAAAEKLSFFLSSLGADLVIDLRVFEDLSLLEQQREFVDRVRDGNHAKSGDARFRFPPLHPTQGNGGARGTLPRGAPRVEDGSPLAVL